MSGEHGAAVDRVKGFLMSRGLTGEAVDSAEAEDALDLLAVDSVLVPPGPRFTAPEVAERSGMPLDQVHRIWRAMGFPDVDDDEQVFAHLDVDGFTVSQRLLVLNTANVDTAVQLMRVMGSAMARVAEAEVTAASALMGLTDRAQVAELFILNADSTIPGIGQLFEYIWRRHLQSASHEAIFRQTRVDSAVASAELVVGFVDLVGYTSLSRQLSEDSLAALVARFETLAHEVVTALGGRVVKMIGDEAMFVVDEPAKGARIGLRLSEVYSEDELLSTVRVGMAAGAVVARDGDYYGPVVNLASRIVSLARPSTVLTSDEMHSVLAADAELQWKALRPREIKDIGEVQLWVLARPSGGPASGDTVAAARQRRRPIWRRG